MTIQLEVERLLGRKPGGNTSPNPAQPEIAGGDSGYVKQPKGCEGPRPGRVRCSGELRQKLQEALIVLVSPPCYGRRLAHLRPINPPYLGVSKHVHVSRHVHVFLS
jgi:hypothetical protein